MDRILYINACARKNSRTRELAEELLSHLEGEVSECRLYDEPLKPLDAAALAERDAFCARKDFSDSRFQYAKDFAQADIVVIAAPYWDMSFPSILKVYFEAVTVCGITFYYNEKNLPVGQCRAKRIYYVTTSGGPISYNGGFDYTRKLASTLYHIDDAVCFTAQGLDIAGADIDGIMRDAKEKIRKYFE